jgi:predicted PhzF superfamily epimerase YddE/YHI9
MVLFNSLGHPSDTLEFESKSGRLRVMKENQWLVMDFPAQPPVLCEITPNYQLSSRFARLEMEQV